MACLHISRAGAAVILAALSIASAPTLAQDPARPTQFAPLKPVPTAKNARIMLDAYAACLVSHRPKVARAILGLDYRTPEYQAKLHTFGSGTNSCRPVGALRIAPVLFAGGLAEAAFRADFSGRATMSLAPGDWTANPIEGRDDMEAAALCVVHRKAADVRALLTTRVASPEETVLVAPLASELAGCLRPDTKFRINKPFFRAILALALYRTARHFDAPVRSPEATS